WKSESHSIDGLQNDEHFDLVICEAFTQHVSDPLHVIRELAQRTDKAMLFNTYTGHWFDNRGMKIIYNPEPHHQKWGDKFPNNFDTKVSKKLLKWSLKECGFREVVELKHTKTWLPWWWCQLNRTFICLK
ncbi:MAG: hypothetical protein ACYDHW_00005, partial [Syntrophorhabdaceae bacterium]